MDKWCKSGTNGMLISKNRAFPIAIASGAKHQGADALKKNSALTIFPPQSTISYWKFWNMTFTIKHPARRYYCWFDKNHFSTILKCGKTYKCFKNHYRCRHCWIFYDINTYREHLYSTQICFRKYMHHIADAINNHQSNKLNSNNQLVIVIIVLIIMIPNGRTMCATANTNVTVNSIVFLHM